MGQLIGEVLGCFILILLGDGVVANFAVYPRLPAAGYDWNTITLGWAMAVVVAVYVTAGVSGAHLNPAVTLALALKRDFPMGKVIPFWIAQIIGCFLGALGVYLCYREGLVGAGMPNVWCTGPGAWGGVEYSLVTALITEIIGTAVLLWGVLASGDAKNLGVGANLGGVLVGLVVLAVGLCLGGPSGYAINPARDLGPRLFGTLAGTTGLFSGLYWLIAPIIGPLIGGVLGAFTYDMFVTANLAKE